MNSSICKTCNKRETLDNLVRHNEHRGNYICKPCAADLLDFEYDPFMTGRQNKTPIKDGRIIKLLRWCIG